jgi:hypothetical protein
MGARFSPFVPDILRTGRSTVTCQRLETTLEVARGLAHPGLQAHLQQAYRECAEPGLSHSCLDTGQQSRHRLVRACTQDGKIRDVIAAQRSGRTDLLRILDRPEDVTTTMDVTLVG